MSFFFTEKLQRRAFLETRQSLEVKLVLEEESQEQVIEKKKADWIFLFLHLKKWKILLRKNEARKISKIHFLDEWKIFLKQIIYLSVSILLQERLLLSVLPQHVAAEIRQDLGAVVEGQFHKIYMRYSSYFSAQQLYSTSNNRNSNFFLFFHLCISYVKPAWKC